MVVLFFVVSTVLALAGVAALLLVWLAWPKAERFARQSADCSRAALVIDTDAAGHFREEDREALELLLIEFAARLSLEDAIRAALG